MQRMVRRGQLTPDSFYMNAHELAPRRAVPLTHQAFIASETDPGEEWMRAAVAILLWTRPEWGPTGARRTALPHGPQVPPHTLPYGISTAAVRINSTVLNPD